jgi:hypothetical protein
MKIRLAAIAATTGFAATAFFAVAPVGAQPAPLPLPITPTSGPVGTTIDLAGTDCLSPAGPGAIEVFVDGAPLINADPANPVLANTDGTWTYPITPDVGSPAGTYQITASCFVNDGTGTLIVAYGPTAFELTEAPAPAPEPVPEAPAEEPAPAVAVVAEPDFTG